MQKDSSDVSAVVLLELKDITMHRFINNKKSLFTSGNCKIAKIDHTNSSTVYFINLNSFYYTLRKDIVFVQIVYDQTVSFLFPHFQNGLSAITLQKNTPQLQNLRQILNNAAVLVNFQKAMSDPTIRSKIQQHCPNIQKQPICNPDGIKQAINTTGKFLNTAFTAIGGLVKGGIQMAGQFINNKIAPGQNQPVNPQTKQKWQSLKQGTNNFFKVSGEMYNKYLDPYVQPVLNKGKQEYTNLKTKIQTSQNQKVKYARELAQTSQKALGEAFDGLVKGGKQVGDSLSTQTKKIVHKKYGDDYVKTFIQGQQQKPGYERVNQQQHQQSKQKQVEQKLQNVKIQYPDLQQKKKQ